MIINTNKIITAIELFGNFKWKEFLFNVHLQAGHQPPSLFLAERPAAFRGKSKEELYLTLIPGRAPHPNLSSLNRPSSLRGCCDTMPGITDTITNKSAELLLSRTTGIISIEQIVQELEMFETTCLTPATG